MARALSLDLQIRVLEPVSEARATGKLRRGSVSARRASAAGGHGQRAIRARTI